MTFSELETYQPDAVASMRRAIKRNRFPHGLILASPGDVGEVELAHRLAKFLLCEHPTAALAPCGACAGCSAVARSGHPDMHEVRPKGLLRAIRTEDMLALIQSLHTTSLSGGAKVGIVYQAETLRKESSNRFLKTLEEPTPNTYFILLTSRLERLLPTIKSRCQIVRLRPLEADALRSRAESELGLTGDNLALVCTLSRGRWRRAAQLAGQLDDYKSTVRELADILARRGGATTRAVDFAQRAARKKKAERAAFEQACKNELSAKSKELADIDTGVRREMLAELEQQLKSEQAARERDEKAGLFEAMVDLWRDVLVCKQTGREDALLHAFLAKAVAELAAKYTENEILRNLADIDLVRGPTVYLNARLDVILQGLLAQANMRSAAFVPLRAAIAATGL